MCLLNSCEGDLFKQSEQAIIIIQWTTKNKGYFEVFQPTSWRALNKNSFACAISVAISALKANYTDTDIVKKQHIGYQYYCLSDYWYICNVKAWLAFKATSGSCWWKFTQ